MPPVLGAASSPRALRRCQTARRPLGRRDAALPAERCTWLLPAPACNCARTTSALDAILTACSPVGVRSKGLGGGWKQATRPVLPNDDGCAPLPEMKRNEADQRRWHCTRRGDPCKQARSRA